MLISQCFLVREKYPLFLQKWSIFLVSKSTSSALFFSGNYDVFHGAETRLQSAACEGDMRGAREKHPVSTVSLCIKNKPTPIATPIGPAPGRRCRPRDTLGNSS
jgi:hypothetical protein